LDLILVTRGGGSLEDLWAFNEEVVARAIYESAIPVVSAVGHEIDFTISDFVADVRAATPSAAAEIITEGPFASRQFVATAGPTLRRLVRQRLEQEEADLGQLAQRLGRVHPRRVLEERLQYLDDLQTSLARRVRQGWRDRRVNAQNLQQRLQRLKPSLLLSRRRQAIEDLSRRLFEQARQGWKGSNHALGSLEERLRLLSPENVLSRGYSITMDAASGRIIRGAKEAAAGQRLKTKLKSGEIRSVVEE
jgi:exodeoxyribonuclease VII large subunit